MKKIASKRVVIKAFCVVAMLASLVCGSDPKSPINLTDDPGGDFEPMWSPDGKKIAFYSDRKPGGKCKYKIFTMNRDGSNQKELNRTNCDFRPVWSPDGKRLAFDSGRDGNHEIYTVRIDGSDLRRLTTSPSYDSSPRWSPDGKKLVYFSGSSGKGYGNSDIYEMNIDGSGKKRLTDAEGDDTYPFYSPDGKQIAFTSYRDGNAEIYLMDSDGQNQRRLTNNRARDDNARWSPDGRKISFGTDRNGKYDGYVMDSDGSNKINVTQHPENDGDISWSPSGQEIAFASKRSGNYEIYRMVFGSLSEIGDAESFKTAFGKRFSYDWMRHKEYTLDLAKAMPEEHFDFKPTTKVRSFAEILLHIASSNYAFSGMIVGKNVKDTFDSKADFGKEEILSIVARSFDSGNDAAKNATDKQLSKVRKWRNRIEGNTTRDGAATFRVMSEHAAHERGKLTLYLRLKGIVPPGYVD